MNPSDAPLSEPSLPMGPSPVDLTAQTTGTPVAPESRLRPGRTFALALVAGAVAGVLSWLIGEGTIDVFKPPLRRLQVMGVTMMVPSDKDQTIANIRNAALAFGVLGALTGMTLGVAGGLARGSVRSGAVAAFFGLVSGGGLGFVASLLVLPLYYRFVDPLSGEVLIPLVIHGAVWAAAGVAGGLAFGMGVGGRDHAIHALLGGLMGALVGSVVYDFSGALFFPIAKTSLPLSVTPGTRLLARLCVTTLTALVAAAAIMDPRRRPGPTPGTI